MSLNHEFMGGVFVVLMALVIGLVVGDIINPGEVCEERGFDTEISFYNSAQLDSDYFCLRRVNYTSEDGDWVGYEIYPLEWVRENCGDSGACVCSTCMHVRTKEELEHER